MKKILKPFSSILLVTVLAFPACQSTKTTAVDDLFVAIEDSKIERFDSVELELEQGVSGIVWSSSNENVAVIEDGVLIGLQAGKTVISAVKGNEKQEQTITVYDEGKTPTIDVDYLPIMRGDEYEMDTKAYFNDEELEDATFTYSVADTSIASIENGVLTGVSYGETSVTISLSWKNQTNVVTKEVPCSVTKNVAVYTDKAEYTLYTLPSVLGEDFPMQAQIQTQVYYEDERIDGLTVTWTIDDENVATIDAEGNLNVVACGETYAVGTCTYNNETLSTRKVPVKVEKPHLKTQLDFPVKVGDADATFDVEKALGEGYEIGSVQNVASGLKYVYTEDGADLSGLATGEYTFNVYEKDEAFSTQVNVHIADCVVTDAESLYEATDLQDGYIVLANDLEVENFTTARSKAAKTDAPPSGTFNGLGHTLRITYAKKSLYSFIGDFVFKNLSVICTAAKSGSGAIFSHIDADRSLVFDNCYFETTFQAGSTECGGVGDYIFKRISITMNNTIVKVNGLDQDETVQTMCGVLFGRCNSISIFLNDTYAIGKGTLGPVGYGDSYGATKVLNTKKVLYETEEDFASAKAQGEIALDGYNRYWDLTGALPKIGK